LKYTFCTEFNFEHTQNFLDVEVIIVTSSAYKTQSICVLFSLPVFFYTSQVTDSIGTRKKRISLTS